MRKYLLALSCLIAFTACKPLPTGSAEVGDIIIKTPSVPNSTTSESGLSGLSLLSSKADNLGFTHKKYEQMYKGIAIWSSEIVIHINADQEIYRTDGKYIDIPDTLNIHPKIVAIEAAKIASESLANDGNWASKSEKLMIYSNQSINSLVWYIQLNKSLQRKFVMVDAVTGEVIKTLQGTYS